MIIALVGDFSNAEFSVLIASLSSVAACSNESRLSCLPDATFFATSVITTSGPLLTSAAIEYDLSQLRGFEDDFVQGQSPDSAEPNGWDSNLCYPPSLFLQCNEGKCEHYRKAGHLCKASTQLHIARDDQCFTEAARVLSAEADLPAQA